MQEDVLEEGNGERIQDLEEQEEIEKET